MRLMSEEKGRRTYLGNDDETWYEVRAELRMQSRTLFSEAYNLPGLRKAAEEETRRDLAKWFRTTGKTLGAEPFGDVYEGWDPIKVEWDESLRDENDRPVPPFETFYVYRCWAEQAYWPAAPVDPDPEPLIPEPKPRRSDFRGDRFA